MKYDLATWFAFLALLSAQARLLNPSQSRILHFFCFFSVTHLLCSFFTQKERKEHETRYIYFTFIINRSPYEEWKTKEEKKITGNFAFQIES